MLIDPDQLGHRPYPLARAPWAMAMVWHDLLFMHWPVAVEVLRPHVPRGLEIDTYTGGGLVDQAFIGVVPFRMSGVRGRGLPGVPGCSAFPELNVRTYVRSAAGVRGAPGAPPAPRGGVWFFSLDAANRLAVIAARAAFHLAYVHARMRCERGAGEARGDDGGPWIEYASERVDRGAAPAAFRGRYRASGPVFRAAAGSLEAFLTERYCLYAADGRGRVWRGEIHHAPWPLRAAEAHVEVNTMAVPLGVDLAQGSRGVGGEWPLLHFADRLSVAAWLPRRII